MRKIIRDLLLRTFEATGYTAAREKEIAAKAAQLAADREQEFANKLAELQARASAGEQALEAKSAELQTRAAAREQEFAVKSAELQTQAAAREQEFAAKSAQLQTRAAAREQELEARSAELKARIAAGEQDIAAKAAQVESWAVVREQEIEAKATQTQAWADAREKEIAARATEVETWAAAREQQIEVKSAQTQAWAAAREREIAAKAAELETREQQIAAKAAETETWAVARESAVEAKVAEVETWVLAREQDIAEKQEWAEQREDVVRRLSENITPVPLDDTRSTAAGAQRPHTDAKIFCIGWQKTGTTSLEAFLKGLGFAAGDQLTGALLLRDWAQRNFDPIIALARTAQVFQDIPFSLPFTYNVLDREFPGAKFILSVRSSADEWYGSLIRFVTQLVGKNRLPTADDLKNFPHPYKGWMFETAWAFGVSEHDLFDKAKAVGAYEAHNAAVAEYFRHRPDALLTVNLADADAAERIMTFLSVPYDGRPMPHLNRTK